MKEISLLLVMNVPSQFVELAMSMSEEKEIKLVHSVKPDTNALRVAFFNLNSLLL